jgi:branched-chain amino acid transport system substrate-binding protein
MLFALLLASCAPAPIATAPAPTAAPTQPPAPTVAPTKVAVPGVTDTEIVLGSWGPQDGPAGAYGVIDRAVAAYFKMANEQGGINGRTVRFIYENDSYQPAKTVAAVKKLVEEDKVFALVAGLGTAQNLAVMDYLIQNNVPNVAPATGSTAMAVPLKKNV